MQPTQKEASCEVRHSYYHRAHHIQPQHLVPPDRPCLVFLGSDEQLGDESNDGVDGRHGSSHGKCRADGENRAEDYVDYLGGRFVKLERRVVVQHESVVVHSQKSESCSREESIRVPLTWDPWPTWIHKSGQSKGFCWWIQIWFLEMSVLFQRPDQFITIIISFSQSILGTIDLSRRRRIRESLLLLISVHAQFFKVFLFLRPLTSILEPDRILHYLTLSNCNSRRISKYHSSKNRDNTEEKYHWTEYFPCDFAAVR